MSLSVGNGTITPTDLYKAVTAKVNDAAFCKEHENNKAPLAMIAMAGTVVEKIILPNRGIQTKSYFCGLTMTIPHVDGCLDPQYHSIVGQKLLLVDWKRMFSLDIPCPCCGKATLQNDRTNFSKNKILFPIFHLDGPPMWCMVMSMTCKQCRARFNANDSAILCRLPAYAAAAYPVDSKFSIANKNSHLGRNATDVFDLIMPTYGNGDLCSRLLYNAMNRAYLERVASFFSYYDDMKQSAPDYLDIDGGYIRSYPPLGDSIRDVYDEASNNTDVPWGINDKLRHTREIQGVRCDSIFAQDHTHEVTKNYFYKRKLGAEALWDVSTETGEIASAVLVPSTKTIHFSHAAKQLVRRPGFKPKAMYSDTWPCKSSYWSLLIGNHIEGRLGLFHFLQRILRTLRRKHIDYHRALNALLCAVYTYNEDDYENLLRALKDGTIASTKFTDDDISDMKETKTFRQRYDKYLRKEIRPPETMRTMLDDWFHRFKCSTAGGSRPALGRLDPRTQQPLFTTETKVAWTNCKDKAEYLQDPLPLDDMYDVILPNPNSTHGLKEYLSRRGESCLESFHLLLAHFANCGMRSSLADNLNLTGTARYNLSIRHKLQLTRLDNNNRKKMPTGWEGVVPYYNHSELAWVNKLAVAAGAQKLPFSRVENLVEDNGERFFSEYLDWMSTTRPKYDAQDRCLCCECGVGAVVTSPTTTIMTAASPTRRTTTVPSPTNRELVTSPKTITNNNTTMTVAGVNRFANYHNDPTTTVTTVNLLPKQSTTAFPRHQQQRHNTPAAPVMPPPTVQFPFGYPPPVAFAPWLIAGGLPRIIQAQPWCCTRYREWHNRPQRRGRPPHDLHCRATISRQEKNQNQII